MRIAVLDDYQNTALGAADWNRLSEADITVFDHPFSDEDMAANALMHFDVLVAMRERTPFPRSLIERLPNLKLLVTTGMRNLAIDGTAARERGVVVCGTQMTSYAAFEHTWALIMAIAKQIPRENQAMRDGRWHEGLAVGLKGKTLGVLGLGRLGAEVARVGLAFNMNVVAWSENLTEERAAEVGVKRVDKDTLFSSADFLTIHLVLSDRTRGLVGAREFGLMKPTAYLINTSRGPIVDETALIDALESRRIGGAAIDVFDHEPLPADHPLRGLDNTVLTGHIGYVVREMFELAYGQAVENIAAWQAGQPVRVINAG